ncbi:MAG: transcriptional repressor LexA [Acidimicrobiales bacterium]
MVAETLSGKRREMLDYIATCLRDRGYPPSVREIGEAVGLASSATVHTHLAVLQREGFLERDPTKPRAIKVRYDPASKEAVEPDRVRHVPLVGDVAAGTGVLGEQRVEEVFPLPETFTGTGPTFMLRVRGDSMIEAGILDGDFVVVRHQEDAENGEVVVAGIPDEEATVKMFARKRGKVVLTPANSTMAPMIFEPDQVLIYGKVLTILRRL